MLPLAFPERRFMMHVTSKETDKDGNHILTSQLEADGPFELASDKAELHAEVVSVERTASGGIQLVSKVSVIEPKPEPPLPVPPKPVPVVPE